MLCSDREIVSFEKVAVSNQSKPHHGNDACSPLCVCNCCGCQGFSSSVNYAYNLIFVKKIIDKNAPEYKSILTSNFFGSIWQPPQIV